MFWEGFYRFRLEKPLSTHGILECFVGALKIRMLTEMQTKKIVMSQRDTKTLLGLLVIVLIKNL